MKNETLFLNRRSKSRRKSDNELREAASNFLKWYLHAVGKHRAEELLNPANTRDGMDIRRLNDALNSQ